MHINVDADQEPLTKVPLLIKPLLYSFKFLTPGSLNGHPLAQIASLRWPILKVLITSGYGGASTHRLPPNATFVAKP